MKKVIFFTLLFGFLFPFQLIHAQGSFEGGNFFSQSGNKLKNNFLESKAKEKEKDKSEQPKPTNQQKKVKGISLQGLTSKECSLWWQIALGLAILLLSFAVFVKKRPENFVKWSSLHLLLVPIIGGLITWQIHYQFHYQIKKYDNAFLCYNYWLIIGFEVIYFMMIYLLLFGIRGVKTKSKRKKSTRKGPKVFDKKRSM
jgi:hypothetical protein